MGYIDWNKLKTEDGQFVSESGLVKLYKAHSLRELEGMLLVSAKSIRRRLAELGVEIRPARWPGRRMVEK